MIFHSINNLKFCVKHRRVWKNIEWENVYRYTEDGNLKPDNNFIENQIRPFALGRKNWLFSNSAERAESSSIIYSIVQTALANGIEPFKYFSEIFAKLPYAKTVDDYQKLLPFK